MLNHHLEKASLYEATQIICSIGNRLLCNPQYHLLLITIFSNKPHFIERLGLES